MPPPSDLRAACIHGRYENHDWNVPPCPGGRVVTIDDLHSLVANVQDAIQADLIDLHQTVRGPGFIGDAE